MLQLSRGVSNCITNLSPLNSADNLFFEDWVVEIRRMGYSISEMVSILGLLRDGYPSGARQGFGSTDQQETTKNETNHNGLQPGFEPRKISIEIIQCFLTHEGATADSTAHKLCAFSGLVILEDW